jgi:beta-lactamase regulating signal transducer with metallopeptidase domain
MISLLIDLTLRGTIVTAIVLVLDHLLTQRMRPRLRRVWWILAALAWLLPLRLPKIPSELSLPLPSVAGVSITPQRYSGTAASPDVGNAKSRRVRWSELLGVVLIAGTFAGLLVTVVRTVRTARSWSGKRLCSDSELIILFEDCKFESGITAPVVLVLTSEVSTPVLLGWLRPRILLPQALVESVSRQQLRSILFHELAHFHSADIPLNWLFSIAKAIHWFNPVVYLASRRWRQYCELAADSTALAWMRAETGDEYGQALIIALRHTHELPIPRGALALGESFESLKERMGLVGSIGDRARMVLLAAVVASVLALFISIPSRADSIATVDPIEAESFATPMAYRWLKILDSGNFYETWNTAAYDFKRLITSDQWIHICTTDMVWGKCLGRKFLSSDYKGKTLLADGDLCDSVLVQFDGTYEKLGIRREKIWVVKEADGQWRFDGALYTP